MKLNRANHKRVTFVERPDASSTELCWFEVCVAHCINVRRERNELGSAVVKVFQVHSCALLNVWIHPDGHRVGVLSLQVGHHHAVHPGVFIQQIALRYSNTNGLLTCQFAFEKNYISVQQVKLCHFCRRKHDNAVVAVILFVESGKMLQLQPVRPAAVVDEYLFPCPRLCNYCSLFGH